MRQEASPPLGDEVAGAATGLMRLVGYREGWASGFDFSGKGFVRSFLAQAAALPFYLVIAAVIARLSVPAAGGVTIGAAGLAHVFETIGFPGLIILLARPLRLQGVAAFIVVMNWTSLILNAALAATSVLALLGGPGVAVFSIAALLTFSLSIFATWRAARECLTEELPAGLLVVVLSVALSVCADRAALWLMKLLF